jgi:hypothetical protein
VIVGVRDHEDGPGTRVVVTDSGDVSVLRVSPDDANWPGRRDDIRIRFWCEYCDTDNGVPKTFRWLQIVQRKGCTHVSWSDE